MTDGTIEHAQDQSLIDDASTLLMFSKTSNSNVNSSDEGKDELKADIHTHKMTPTPSAGTASQVGSQAGSHSGSAGDISMHMNPMTSPGPASVALIKDDDDDDHLKGSPVDNGIHRSNSNSEKTKKSGNKKGMVAAAALAQAATMPLPLKRKAENDRKPAANNSVPMPRSGAEEKSPSKQAKSEDKVVEQEDSFKEAVEEQKLEKSETDRFSSVPESYVVDPDAGIITCICGYEDDDGFTIQCDHCFRWQHAICYGIEHEKDAPDDFLCNICNSRFVDVKLAKKKQQERIRNAQNKKRRRTANGNIKEVKTKEATSGTKDSRNPGTSEATDHRIEPEAIPSADPLTNIVLINAKEAYPTVYLPLTSNDYKDKYVELFVKDHADDDWVIPYHKLTFKPIPIEIKPYSDSNHSRLFPGYPKLAVYLKQGCDEGDYIDEFLGEIDFQRKYLEDPRNNYRVWGTAKPKVIIHPHWPIYIDARLSGNLTRYLRRSCNPNVELVTIKLTNSNNQDEIKFVLRALRFIDKGEELHIKWDWDLRHPIWKLINHNESIDSIEEPQRYLFIHSIDTILGSCDCACGSNSKDCYLLKIKRHSQSLYRSVKSKMNNRYKLNEILHGNKLQTKKQSSILSKLAHATISDAARANEFLLKFNAVKLKMLEPVSDTVQKKSFHTNAGSIRGNKYRVSVTESKNRVDPLKESLSFISDPSKFDESQIKHPADLPIPIQTISTEDNPPTDTTITNITETISNQGQTNVTSDSNSIKNSLKRGIDSVPGPSSTIHQAQMKKKLSFADYKKKIKPA